MSVARVTRAPVLIGAFVLICIALAVDVPTMPVAVDWPPFVIATAKALSALVDSGWMVVFLLALCFVASLLRMSAETQDARAEAALFLNLCMVLFVAILLSGMAGQALSQLIVRPRHVEMTGLGAVGLFAAWLFPRRWPAIVLAVVGLALTRLLVQMQSLSDSVAGLTLGAVCAALLLRAVLAVGAVAPRDSAEFLALGATLEGLWPRVLHRVRPHPSRPDIRLLRLTLVVLGATLGALAIFLAMPWLDIWVSGLFWSPEQGFFLTQNQTLRILRDIYLNAIFALLLAALVLFGFHLRLGAALLVTPRAVWSFVALAIIIGPGLVANSLFKEHWGRARPANIEAFGGTAQFTLPLEMADQCQSNCAFVSGEGSGISMLALIIGVLAWPWIRRRIVLRLGLLVAVAGVGMGLRVALGRHFLSDTVFAGLFMALIALALYKLLNLRVHLRQLSLSGLRHDAGVMGDYLRGSGPDKGVADLKTLIRALWGVMAAFACILAAPFAVFRTSALASDLSKPLGRKIR